MATKTAKPRTKTVEIPDVMTGELFTRVIIPICSWAKPRTQFTKRYESPTGLSMTVPDMVLTRKQIVERHVRKIPVAGFAPIYLGNADEIPFEMPEYGADRQEVMDHMLRVNRWIQDLRNSADSQLSRTPGSAVGADANSAASEPGDTSPGS